MKKFIKDEKLLKDAFQALVYFVFISGAAKLTLPEVINGSIYFELGAIIIVSILTILGVCYSSFHASANITRLYFPSFKTPIDDDYQKVDFIDLYKKPDFLLWFSICIPYILLGVNIVTIGIQH